MYKCDGSGFLRGRPFGGVYMLVLKVEKPAIKTQLIYRLKTI